MSSVLSFPQSIEIIHRSHILRHEELPGVMTHSINATNSKLHVMIRILRESVCPLRPTEVVRFPRSLHNGLNSIALIIWPILDQPLERSLCIDNQHVFLLVLDGHLHHRLRRQPLLHLEITEHHGHQEVDPNPDLSFLQQVVHRAPTSIGFQILGIHLHKTHLLKDLFHARGTFLTSTIIRMHPIIHNQTASLLPGSHIDLEILLQGVILLNSPFVSLPKLMNAETVVTISLVRAPIRALPLLVVLRVPLDLLLILLQKYFPSLCRILSPLSFLLKASTKILGLFHLCRHRCRLTTSISSSQECAFKRTEL